MNAREYGNRPAFPHAAMTEQVTFPTQHPGMTVHEVFAGLAMQGLLANTDVREAIVNPNAPTVTGEHIAAMARVCADALVAELAKDGA